MIKKFSAFSFQLSVIFVLTFICAGFSQAAPVGSSASLLKKGKWNFALGGESVSRRPMESSVNADYEVSVAYGYHSRSFGLADRLTITGKVGGSYGYVYDETTPGAELKTSLSGGLALGLQLKGIIFQNKEAGFELDGSGQFLYMRSHHKRSGKANADWYEWQASSSVAKEIGRFKPYAGVKFSIVDLEHDDGKGNKTSYDETGSVSPFVGMDIFLGQDRDIIINAEGGFLLGTQFSGGIIYRF